MPEKIITKEKLREILQTAPPGSNPQRIIGEFQRRGWQIEGMEAQPQPVKVPTPSQPTGNFFQQEVTGGAERGGEGIKGFAKDIFQSTLGSRGLTGLFQLPGQVAAQPAALRSQTQVSETAEDLANMTTQLIQKRREEQDPARRRAYTEAINSNLQTLNELNQSGQELGRFVRTPGEAVATGANAALTASTLGTGNLATRGTLAAAQRIAPRAVPAVTKAVTVARGVVPKAVEGGLAGAGFKASQNLEEGKPITEDTFNSLITGAVIPVGIAGVGAGKQAVTSQISKTDSRIINSLIRPGKSQFAYGKNPGRAVASEGITANSIDELATKITTTKEKVGQELESALEGATGSINVTSSLSAIDDALLSAKRAPKTNKALIGRLKDLQSDLTEQFTGKESVSPKEAAEMKRLVGELAKFTGNASDDELVNQTTIKVYGRINDQINKAAPDVKDLNGRYGDLLQAEVATKARAQAVEKLNLLGLGDLTTGIGAAFITGDVLTGAAVVAIKKALSSTRGKTEFAKWFNKASSAAKTEVMEKSSFCVMFD